MKKHAWRVTLVLLAVLLFSSVPAWAQTTIYVDDDNCPGPGSGAMADPYCKIQDAINSANPGDIISVSSGTYDETITIAKPITLSGADKTNTIITYSGTPDVAQQVFLGTNVGLDLAGPVTIENFTFFNGGSLYDDNDLIKFRARGVGGQITIRNNIFDCDGDGTPAPAKAIEEAYQASNFVITGNDFNICQYGIWLNGGQNGEISNNTFSNFTSGAIGMGGSDAGALAPHNLTVTGNIMDNASYGLVLAQNIHDVSFSCNTITNNSFAGVLLWEYGPVDWSNVHINYNNIVGNVSGMRGFYDPGGNPSITVDAINNWWGDGSGPSGSGPGSGDSVLLTSVNFDPWLTSQIGAICPPPADDEGPITTNVVGEPISAPVDTSIDLTATVDDTDRGDSNIASADFVVKDSYGIPVASGSMDADATTAAIDGFDSVTEEVTASIGPFDTPVVLEVCVSGTDVADNTGPEECILLAIFDPDAGFVTGGGWIDSPAGAMSAPADVTLSGPFADAGWGGNYTRDTSVVCDPNNTPVTLEGWVDVSDLTDNGGLLVGLLDKKWIDDGNHGFFSGAYAYFGRRSTNLRIGPSDGNAGGGELNQVGANVTFDPWENVEINFSAEIFNGQITVTYGGNDYVDTYGDVPPGLTWDEFEFGAYPGVDLWSPDGSVDYEVTVSGCEASPTGKANFGFVAKYKKGANVPDGNTEFQFKAGNLNFHSTSYEWLVVTGNDTAKFKGEGTINGDVSPAGPYKFQLWASDGDPDTFRIKIWWEDGGTEHFVYDNGMNQAIGGGNIVVHTK